MDELAYIIAIIKETASHRLVEDDLYKETFIPTGTMLLKNIWLVHPIQLRLDCS